MSSMEAMAKLEGSKKANAKLMWVKPFRMRSLGVNRLAFAPIGLRLVTTYRSFEHIATADAAGGTFGPTAAAATCLTALVAKLIC